MAKKKVKAAGKRKKKIDASKVRVRDLDAKKGSIAGGGFGGGFGGFQAEPRATRR